MKRRDLFFGIITLIIVLLFTNGFFVKHYTSDAYNYLIQGFDKYSIDWFLPAGRFVGMIFLFIASKLNLDYFKYIIIMEVISVCVSTISIMVLYKIIISVAQSEEKRMSFLILLASILTLINNASYQFFYYAESAVMWLGILFSLLSIKAVLNNKLILSFILLFISVNCYQAVTFITIPLLIVLGFRKNDFDLKSTVKILVKYGIFLGISIMINYLILMVFQKVFNIENFKSTVIDYKFGNLTKALYEIIIPNGNLIIILKTVLVFMFFIFISRLKEQNFKTDEFITFFIYAMTFLSSLILSALVIGILNFYFAIRIIFSYAAIIGITMIFMILYLRIEKKKYIKIFYCFAFFILVIDIVNFNYTNKLHQETNRLDFLYGKQIANLIEEYERESGNEIKVIEYCWDKKMTWNYFHTNNKSEEVRRALSGEWCFNNVLNVIMDRKFEKKENNNLRNNVFKGKNWDEYSDEQVIFDGEKMYYCIY